MRTRGVAASAPEKWVKWIDGVFVVVVGGPWPYARLSSQEEEACGGGAATASRFEWVDQAGELEGHSQMNQPCTRALQLSGGWGLTTSRVDLVRVGVRGGRSTERASALTAAWFSSSPPFATLVGSFALRVARGL